jgi:tetratricopeptide (TPR) repeat protein
MRRRRLAAAATLALGLLLPAGAAPADVVVLKDGRAIEGVEARQEGEEWILRFGHGEVRVPAASVKDAFIEKSPGAWEPRTDAEKEKFAQGLVPHEGKWVKKEQRAALLKKKADEKRKQIEDLKAHREWRNRYREETANFAFEYTITPDVAKDYMELMEAYFKVFQKEWGIQRPPKIGKLTVCFYHDYDYFIQVGGVFPGILAYYRFVPPLELNFFYDRYSPVFTEQVMFHEASHYLQHLIDLDFGYPHCFGEALAEYYGASRWDRATKKLTVGLVQEGRLTEVLEDIRRGTWHKLEDYLSNKLGYEDYTWGWSFVHFMMSTPKYAARFRKFFLSLARGSDVKRSQFRGNMRTVEGPAILEAFRKSMGITDLAPLEKEWHEYIQNGLKITTERGFEEAGHAAWRNGQTIKAKRFYKEALEKGSRSPEVHANYADALLRDSKVDEAVELLKKGVAFDPLNGRLYMALGNAVGMKEGEESKKESRRLRLLAREIDPDNVDWFDLADEDPPDAPPDDGK